MKVLDISNLKEIKYKLSDILRDIFFLPKDMWSAERLSLASGSEDSPAK